VTSWLESDWRRILKKKARLGLEGFHFIESDGGKCVHSLASLP
jgi:hypothetical protein